MHNDKESRINEHRWLILGRRLTQWVDFHRLLVATIVFVVLGVALLAGRFQPVNLHYTISFNHPIDSKSRVLFRFETNPNNAKAARQKAVVYGGGTQATIWVDPLNTQSKTLSIMVPNVGREVRVTSFNADVQIRGHRLWGVADFSGEGISQNIGNDDALVVSLNAEQLDNLHHQSQLKSEPKVFLLILLIVAYAACAVKIKFLTAMRARTYVPIVLASVLCISAFMYESTMRRSFAIRGVSYKLIIGTILLYYALLVLMNCALSSARVDKTAKTVMCIANYVSVAVYAVMQFAIYLRYYIDEHSYDEAAHLSYIAYENVHNELLPHFEDMYIYSEYNNFSGVLSMNEKMQFNQLGHPPLYYLIMSHVLGMRNDGSSTVLYNITLLRCESFIIGFAGICLAFYLGFTRIRRIPILHLLFALMIISPPNLLLTLTGLNNETLTIFTVAVFLWGCIRFYEKRYTYATYVLIAVGVTTTLLTKLTAGMIVGFASLLIVSFAMIVRKNIKAIARKEFWVTIPIYLFAILYYSMLFVRYRTIQPSFQRFDLKGYYNSAFYTPIDERISMPVSAYPKYFIHKFIESWYSLVYPANLGRPNTSLTSLDAIAITAVLLVPLVVFMLRRNELSSFLSLGLTGTWLVIAYQAYAAGKGFFANGYIGGYQSRYYLCALPLFAFSVIYVMESFFLRREKDRSSFEGLYHSDSAVLTHAGLLVSGVFILLLVYDGFISSFFIFIAEIPGIR